MTLFVPQCANFPEITSRRKEYDICSCALNNAVKLFNDLTFLSLITPSFIVKTYSKVSCTFLRTRFSTMQNDIWINPLNDWYFSEIDFKYRSANKNLEILLAFDGV